jgi:hypothetical protein
MTATTGEIVHGHTHFMSEQSVFIVCMPKVFPLTLTRVKTGFFLKLGYEYYQYVIVTSHDSDNFQALEGQLS